MPDENDSADFVPGGPVERWLDEVFDGLTGTGAAGRRALIEIEDHLRAAVSEERGRGLDPAAAERAAVTRFGSPTKIARDLRAAHRDLLRAALTGLWALAGAALLSYGLATTVAVASAAVLQGGLGNRPCVFMRGALFPHGATGCHNSIDVTPVGILGLELFGLGALVTVALALTRRRTAMRTARWQPGRRALVTAEVLFVLAGTVVTFGTTWLRQLPWPVATTVAEAVSVAAVAITVWLGRLRQRPVPAPE